MALALIGGFLAVFGTAAPAGAATESFALSSATLPGQSSVGWQVGLGNPPTTPNVWPDPITLTGQIDPSTGAISGATLTMPPMTEAPTEGETPTFTFSEVNPGTATGTFDATTGAVTLSDTFTLTFSITGAIDNTCVSTPINVAFSGTYDSTSENVTLATISSFTIPQFPVTADCIGAVAAGVNASPGGVAGSVGNAMSLALHGQFAPGLPTKTTLSVSPSTSPQLSGTSVTLNATVADPSNQGTPTGTVTFFDNGANIGSEALSGSDTASITTSSLPSGADQQLTAVYSGDTTYSGSTSSAVPYTVTPLPTIGANLPSTMTVPSASAQQPSVTAVSPGAGPTAGGTQVTITGGGFTPGSTVSFGSTPATNVTATSSTSITATSPAGTGTVDVTVTTSGSTSATSAADLFAYGAPTVSAVSPNTGPTTSALPHITITGTHFASGATVNFGSTPARAVTVTSATQITVTAPTASTGTVDVTVTTPAGTSATSAADQYTFNATAPAVSDLRTPSGPAAGGTSVVIDGFNLTGATAVDFGTVAGTITADTATTVTATSPAGTSGSTVNVTVTTPSATSATGPSDQFTYGPPTVTAVSPAGGPAAGGTTVTITGTGFAASAYATADSALVYFGTTEVATAARTVNSLTSITATAPAGTGTVDVTVKTTSGGTSATSAADEFTYAPTVTAVSPPSGPTAGATPVTITGTGFTGATAVDFGTAAATGVTVVSSTEITATSPKGTAGSADVTVTTSVGTSATSTADQFFYGAPTVSAVSPNAGPTGGGTTVTVTGAGFTAASAVKFGTTAATSYTVKSATQITAVSPGGTAGSANITVTTSGGTSAAAAFTYNTAPSVTSLTPDTGSPNGGTGVTITGANFTAATGVSFGTSAATNVVVVSPTTITATSPAGSGPVDVTVSSASGTSAAGSGDVFAYGAPTVSAVTPKAGPISGGTSVTITGAGFVSGTTVSFGTTSATSMTITSPTSITAVSPAESAGAVHVTVTTPGGTSITSANDLFTYSAGGAPGQASFTVTNPSTGQSWDNLYVEIVLTGINKQPAKNVTVSYQDSSGTWCSLTVSGTTTTTTYFSGVGSTCANAPGSFSLAPGASLSVPLQLSYASDTYLGVQTVTATLYSGTCSSATSCTQSGALNGSVVGSGNIQLVPPGLLASTVTDAASSPVAGSSYRQGFLVGLNTDVAAAVSATGTPLATGTVEYLVDGAPATLVSIGAPVSNPVTLVPASTVANVSDVEVDTANLSPGVHTLVSEYSGDSVFAPSSLTETFTVLPAPVGIPFTCAAATTLANAVGLGYVTATSSSPSPTPSGTSAWVTNTIVTVDFDPSIWATGASATAGFPSTFTLSPGGSMSGQATTSTSATDDVATWSGLSVAVPVTGDPGTTVPISVGSFGYSDNTSEGTDSLTCTPVSVPAPLTTVTVAGTTLTASPSGSAAPGAPVTLTATVASAPTSNPGTVEFFDGPAVLGSSAVSTTTGTATFTTNQLALGTHQLSAVWSGTLSIPANTSNTVGYQVGSTSTTTLASSANPANAAQPVTFTAAVTPQSGATAQPTGDVAFTEDGNPIASCASQPLSMASPPTATCTLSFGAGESHSIVATYSGDGNFTGSASGPLTQTTLPGTTSTVFSTKDPSPPGNVTFWAGVSPSGTGATPTGNVAFTIDNKPYAPCGAVPLGSGGGASCTVSFKAGTTHKVFATYAGSTIYSGSTSNTITQTVSGSSSSTKPKTTTATATLASGKTLTSGQSLTAGNYRLTMQSDGNLVEYQGSKARWASGTSGHPGTAVVMQKNGDLVEYQKSKAIWSTKTADHEGAHLTLQAADGNVVIYTTANKPVWATGT